jgi:hypothetical protein
METERAPVTMRHPEAKPTGRQIYALAHELCKRAGERFPAPCLRDGGGDASELIERLRVENGKA